MKGVRTAALVAVAVAVLAALVGQAVRAHAANVRQVRRLEALDRSAGRLREENERLEAERRALDEDPAYVESLQRQSNRAVEGEKLIEK